MNIREDHTGLESLPLRLMVIAVVAGLSVIPAANCLEGFETKEFVQRAEQQLEKIVSAAEIMAMQGPGSVRTLSIDLRDRGAAEFSKIVLGDREDGPNMSSAIIVIGDNMRLIRSATEPAVWLRSSDYDATVIASETFDLRMSVVLDDRGISILVEETGWTS